MPFLPPNQQRQSTEGNTKKVTWYIFYSISKILQTNKKTRKINVAIVAVFAQAAIF